MGFEMTSSLLPASGCTTRRRPCRFRSGWSLYLAHGASNRPDVLAEAAVDPPCADTPLRVDHDVAHVGHVHPVAFHAVGPDDVHSWIGQDWERQSEVFDEP